MAHAGVDYTDPPTDDAADDPPGGDSIRLDADGANRERLDRFLVTALAAPTVPRLEALSRSRIQRWIAIGAVRVDGAMAMPSQRLRGFERIEVWPQPLESEQAFRPEPIDLEVIHADADVAVIAKPAGLVTHPAPGHWQGTLMNGLLHRFPATASLPRAGIVHRLDRDTSGLLVCALSERGFASLTRQLADRSMRRTYLAVMPSPPTATGTIDRPIGRDPQDRLRMAVVDADRAGAREARTDWRILESNDGIALVECRLHTGRTHQIRVHFEAIGSPLIGDPVYHGRRQGRAGATGRGAGAIERQALHAWRLRFAHPDGSGDREFVVAPPADFLGLLGDTGLGWPPTGAIGTAR